MTTQQVLLVSLAYLIALCAVVYFTRATARRVIGALVGGAVVSVMGVAAIRLGEGQGWWHVPFATTPYFLSLFYLGLGISVEPIYLVTWRVARRFGWRGLAVFVGVVGIVGPPRDYGYAAMFPAWMVFAPGVVPILADGAIYVLIVVVGHAVMRVVAGPAGADRLARDPKVPA